MIKSFIIKRIKNLSSRELDDLKIQNGKLFENNIQNKLKSYKNINEIFFKVFSQDYEDGILQYLLKSLNISSVKFVEIGTQDYSESNTRYIFETMRCEGLIIDPTANLENLIKKRLKLWQNNLKIFNGYVSDQNINTILKETSFENELDLFSIDIDGIDYWILKKLKKKISKIFIAEYNPYFGPNKEICAPNIENFDRFRYHKSGFCFGMSIKALINLMNSKGYSFIGTNRLNCNAFFLRKDLINKISLKIPALDDLSTYSDVTFKVLKKNNKLVSHKELEEEIKKIYVFNIKKNKIEKFSLIK